MFEYFKKRSNTPIEDRNYSLHYLVLAGILFLSTMWVVVDQAFSRAPWKEHQKDFYGQLKANADSLNEVADKNLEKPRTAKQLEKIQAELASAKDALFSDEYVNLEQTLEIKEKELLDWTTKWRFARGTSDQYYYEFKATVHHGEPDPAKEQKLRDIESQIAEYFKKMELVKSQRDSISDKLKSLKAKVTVAEDAIQKIMVDKNAAMKKLEIADSKKFEIKQTILAKFTRNNFEQIVDEIDRCATCHLQISEPTFQASGSVFNAHPKKVMEVHNFEEMGCISCHAGQGRALTAGMAHGWEDHYWNQPMHEKSYTEAGCFKCHASRVNLPEAPQLTKGLQLITDFGCQGCHVLPIELDLPKVGPELNNITKKTNIEWIADWIKNPSHFSPNTRMPNFYLTDDQVNDITAFLAANSKTSTFTSEFKYSNDGNAERGKQVMNEVGCIACHAIDQHVIKGRVKEGPAFGPDLNKTGNKVNPDWLYDWVMNPKHYSPTTKMPSMRLSTQEGKDVVAYLMTKKDSNYKPKVAIASDITDSKRVQRGSDLVKSLGCYGCHAIKGTETLGNVSVSLVNIASKTKDSFDFGDANLVHVHQNRPTEETAFVYTKGVVNENGMPDTNEVEYSWYGWIRGKMSHSRRYSTERIHTAMPDFKMNQEETEAVTTALLAWTGQWYNDEYKEVVSKELNKGRQFVRENNCVGCHLVENYGWFIKDKVTEARGLPPNLSGAGSRFREDWLLSFLKNPIKVRPWLKIRMPSFGHTDQEWNTVIKYFSSLAKEELEIRQFEIPKASSEAIATGKQLFTEFKCQQCHVVSSSGQFTDASNAPNLTLASSRLKPEFISKWLRNPGAFQPGTMMPAFFTTEKTYLTKYYDGDSQQQIQALSAYLLDMSSRK